MEKTESNSEKNLKVYEVGYLLVPTIAEEQVAAEAEAIKSLLTQYEAEFISEDFPKLQQLSYSMAKSANGAVKQKFDKAYFGWIKFAVLSEVAQKIKTDLDKNSKILRYIIISTVRENTLISQKVSLKQASEEGGVELINQTEEPVKVDEAELDRTLNKLVATE